MIKDTIWFKIKNNMFVHGYDYNHYLLIDHLNICRSFKKVENSMFSYDESTSYKLTKKENKYIKSIFNTIPIFDDFNSAIKYYDRQKILNDIFYDI